ncbi:MAG TPA: protocatechuate 3,4-dioxygenase subunit alpha [Chloroflexota bacterium]
MSAPLVPTPSQTVGPFFEFGLLDPPQHELVPAGTPGAVRIEGVVFDGQGLPIPDAMIEIWQAAPSGRYPHPEDPRAGLPIDDGFTGFGRSGTDASGTFWFMTVKPGPVPWPDGRPQAPHLNLSVFARGLLKRLVTRLYFPDESAANALDPLLSSLDPSVGSTLVAVEDRGVLHFNIRLQGQGETCFFQV